jgi:hypothetical protein
MGCYSIARVHADHVRSPPPSSKTPFSAPRSDTCRSVFASEPAYLLGAGLAFLDRVARLDRLTRDSLATWIDRHLIQTCLVDRSFRLHEPLIGVLPTDRQCAAFLPERPPADEIAAVLVRARARVIGTLRGLLKTPADDRLLSAAMFAGRVRRVMNGNQMIWVQRPRSHDSLSNVVLSLFHGGAGGQKGPPFIKVGG